MGSSWLCICYCSVIPLFLHMQWLLHGIHDCSPIFAKLLCLMYCLLSCASRSECMECSYYLIYCLSIIPTHILNTSAYQLFSCVDLLSDIFYTLHSACCSLVTTWSHRWSSCWSWSSNLGNIFNLAQQQDFLFLKP